MDVESGYDPPHSRAGKPTAVITIRMTREMHEQLKEAAHRAKMSLNQWCISQFESQLTSSKPSITTTP